MRKWRVVGVCKKNENGGNHNKNKEDVEIYYIEE